MYYLSPDNKPLALGCNAGFCHYPARIGNLNPSDFLQVFLTFRPSGPVAIPYKILHFHEFHGTLRGSGHCGFEGPREELVVAYRLGQGLCFKATCVRLACTSHIPCRIWQTTRVPRA